MDNSITVTRAEEINHLHRIINESMKSVLEKQKTNFMEIGRLLQDQKAELGHGNFAKWINESCNFSYRTARSYIQAYRQNGNAANLEEMSLRKAIESKVLRTESKLVIKTFNDIKLQGHPKFESELDAVEYYKSIIAIGNDIKQSAQTIYDNSEKELETCQLFGITLEQYQMARKIRNHSEELFQRVKNSDLDLLEAMRIVELQLANGDKN